MIVQEKIEGGLIRTYSDIGMMIHGGDPEGDYVEAIDPEGSGRTYTETDIPAEPEEDATVADYEAALERLGVDVQ